MAKNDFEEKNMLSYVYTTKESLAYDLDKKKEAVINVIK
jgi:hypothetical protein